MQLLKPFGVPRWCQKETVISRSQATPQLIEELPKKSLFKDFRNCFDCPSISLYKLSKILCQSNTTADNTNLWSNKCLVSLVTVVYFLSLQKKTCSTDCFSKEKFQITKLLQRNQVAKKTVTFHSDQFVTTLSQNSDNWNNWHFWGHYELSQLFPSLRRNL